MSIWWPFDTPVYPATYPDRWPIWTGADEEGGAGYVDPTTGEPLPTWHQALDRLHQEEHAEPLHVLPCGTRPTSRIGVQQVQGEGQQVGVCRKGSDVISKVMLAEDRLWSVEDVSYYLGVPVQTLYSWRGQGRGPDARRVGRRLRYRPEDVKAWVASLPPDVAA